MVEYYTLYLELFASASVGDVEDFGAAVDSAVKYAEGESLLEVRVVAVLTSQGAKGSVLLDFYDFQQAFERYRNTAPRT